MMKHIGRRALAAAIVALGARVFLPAGFGAAQSVDQFTPVLASPVARRARLPPEPTVNLTSFMSCC